MTDFQEYRSRYGLRAALSYYFPVALYFDLRDWWVGYYRGEEHHYVCILPTLVLRWPRYLPKALRGGDFGDGYRGHWWTGWKLR